MTVATELNSYSNLDIQLDEDEVEGAVGGSNDSPPPTTAILTETKQEHVEEDDVSIFVSPRVNFTSQIYRCYVIFIFSRL